MRTYSPLRGISTEGSAPRGTRSEALDSVRSRTGRVVGLGGGEDWRISVEDVGTGVR